MRILSPPGENYGTAQGIYNSSAGCGGLSHNIEAMLRPGVNKCWDLKQIVNGVKATSSFRPEILQSVVSVVMLTQTTPLTCQQNSSGPAVLQVASDMAFI